METAYFLAFDLGATSGRAMLGSLAEGRLGLQEIHRFPNRIVSREGTLHWDFEALWVEILEGLRKAADMGYPLTSVGIDTWGVDVAFFDAAGTLIDQPYCYRNPAFAGSSGRFFSSGTDRERPCSARKPWARMPSRRHSTT